VTVMNSYWYVCSYCFIIQFLAYAITFRTVEG